MKFDILAISGSTRKSSVNNSVLHTLAAIYDTTCNVSVYDRIQSLPHFDPDVKEHEVPETVKEFLAMIGKADGIFFCTPEYVFSLPGALKNALEWTVSSTVFTDKPVGFIVASAEGSKTYESLNLILKTLVQQEIPQESTLLIQGARGKINETGIKDSETLNSIKNTFEAFINNIQQKS